MTFFSFISGARVRTTAAPVSRGVCIMSDNVLRWLVCSDGITSASPRPFRQNRPPAHIIQYEEVPPTKNITAECV